MGRVQSVLRSGYFAVLGLPMAFGSPAARARVTRRVLRLPLELRGPGVVRAVAHSLLSAAVGVVAWFVVFLAGIAAVRGIFYPLVAASGYENAWGGPTLAGAWAVHAALGVGLLPVWAVLLAGIGAVELRLAQRLLGRNGPWWPVPVALVLFLVGIVFFMAWLHQA
ncbi:sensor domain-containing protein [Nocardia sp. IFM 10818]